MPRARRCDRPAADGSGVGLAREMLERHAVAGSRCDGRADWGSGAGTPDEAAAVDRIGLAPAE